MAVRPEWPFLVAPLPGPLTPPRLLQSVQSHPLTCIASLKKMSLHLTDDIQSSISFPTFGITHWTFHIKLHVKKNVEMLLRKKERVSFFPIPSQSNLKAQIIWRNSIRQHFLVVKAPKGPRERGPNFQSCRYRDRLKNGPCTVHLILLTH